MTSDAIWHYELFSEETGEVVRHFTETYEAYTGTKPSEIPGFKWRCTKYVPEVPPETIWQRFMDHLEKVHPVKSPKDPTLEYVNLIGSVKKFRKIFVESQK